MTDEMQTRLGEPSMIAPGQEELAKGLSEEIEREKAKSAIEEWDELSPQLDEFLKSMPEEASEEPSPDRLLAGKFKNADELEKAYIQAEKLIGQQRNQSAAEPAPEQYTVEMGHQLYGRPMAEAFQAAAINPLAMAQKVYAGQDVSSEVDALVSRAGLSRPLVETYLRGVGARDASSEPASPGLSTADVAEIKDAIGGERQWLRLTAWAQANFNDQELSDYNAAIDSGNKAAARFAVMQLNSRASADAREPRLIGGGSAVQADVFETQQQVVAAMNKLDDNGELLYRTSPKYRQKVDRALARSSASILE